MKILLSWSSGKDSAWALHVLNQRHPGTVGALFTTVNESVDHVTMHAVRRDVLEAQAAAAGLPLRVVPIPEACSNEIYEARMGAAVAAAVKEGFTHAAFSDLFLEDVRRYREERLAGSGLEPLFPLWSIETWELAAQMIEGSLRARLACVDTRVLDRSLAGREWDRVLLREFQPGIDPCGENGEFHTCALTGPMFMEPLELDRGDTVTREPFTWVDLTIRPRDQGPVQGRRGASPDAAGRL